MASPPVELAPTTAALHDEPSTTQTIGKRKRTPEFDPQHITQQNGDTIKIDPQTLESFQALLPDIVEVLGDYDTCPSILHQPITTVARNSHGIKRTKLNDADVATTVSLLVESQAYNEIDSFYRDVKAAIASVASEELGKTKDKLTKFESELDQIIQYELDNSPFPIPRAVDDEMTVLLKKESSDTLSTDPDLVLTTTGIAHGSMFPARRLYSSLRLSAANLSRGKDVLASLDLDRLPHGITAASVRTEKATNEADSNAPTLSKLSSTSKHLRRLEPPKTSSNAATRGQTITWSHPEPNTRPPRGSRASFYNQMLSSGQWLSYNVAPSSSQLPSTGEKRKQRDRALSTGEANAELTEEEQEEIRLVEEIRQRARDDALFKSSYSSFAPTHDDTAAVVPQQLKSRLWWDKFGSSKSIRYFDEYEETEVEDAEDIWEPLELEVAGDDTNFEKMVDTWEDLDTTPPDMKVKNENDMDANEDDKDADDLLQEVSDMLETLSSYQRNRNVSVNNKQQSWAIQSKSLVELTGDTSTPSNPESALYETLKSQLAFIISRLPPHVVTKLDGKKLGALNISTKVVAHTPIHKGTLSKQEPPRSSQTSVPNATPASRAQSGPASRIPSYQQPISASTNRTSSNTPKTSGNSYPNTGYRQSSNTNNYNTPSTAQQQASKVSYSQYGQQPSSGPSSQLPNGTRATSNGYSSYGQQSTPSARSPNALPPGQFQRPSQPGYQQRAANAATVTAAQQQTYSNYNINMHNRSNSPPNPANGHPNQTQRGSHSTPGQTPSRASWFPMNGTIGSMFSAEEAAHLENRQKAQMAAQAEKLRQNSGTPQPARPTSVQSNGAQSTGTPVPQPNGDVEGS